LQPELTLTPKKNIMKRNYLSMLLVSGLFLIGTLASCTKEGPAGPPGADGTNGTNGTNGTDGTTTCVECHSDNQALFSRENQWAHSTHALGGNYERNTADCAGCHTSQGFIGFRVDGTYDPSADGAFIPNPNPINCYTCHFIHDTYTVEDLKLTVSEPVVLYNTDGATFDFGKGDVCASCHQGRPVDPWPTPGGPDVVVSGSRYGVHHGPQANTLSGMGLESFGASSNHPHKNIPNGCVTCHMADAFGSQAGGHTMNITYDYHGATEVNTAGCIACHTPEEAIQKLEELQPEVEALLAELKTELDAAGITAEGSDNSISGTYPADVAAACLNYKAIVEDRSLGVHNPTYIKGVLNNSIAALQAK
jgi:hypothetical protein